MDRRNLACALQQGPLLHAGFGGPPIPSGGAFLPTLYLMRHAPALQEKGFARDAERPLSDQGRRLMAAACGGLRREGVEPEGILSSPYLRARETAAIVAGGLGVPERVQVLAELASGATWDRVSAALHSHAHRASLLLVGHQPDLSEMAASILPDGPALSFPPGSVACIDVMTIPPVRPGVLLWQATAENLAGMQG